MEFCSREQKARCNRGFPSFLVWRGGWACLSQFYNVFSEKFPKIYSSTFCELGAGPVSRSC